MRGFQVSVCCLSVMLLMGLWATPVVLAEEKPQYGGILNVALAADPPSLDMHQEQTFAVAQPLGPIYNNLIQFDPHNYPQIIGDLAKAWTVSDDYLTYTFTLHQGVKFHAGSALTAADVKASWDRMVAPPEGVISPRQNWGRFSDPMVDALFQQQAQEMNEEKRMQLVKEMDKRILEKVWRIQGLWMTRIEVRWAKIRNYAPQPSHWMNRRFEDVWLAEK